MRTTFIFHDYCLFHPLKSIIPTLRQSAIQAHQDAVQAHEDAVQAHRDFSQSQSIENNNAALQTQISKNTSLDGANDDD
jgi:hypothetical protein